MDDDLGELPQGDVLVDDGMIVEVAPRIGGRQAAGAERIDASDKIVMPGLIDNHRHMWESLIRGYSASQTFGQYFQSVLFTVAPRLTADDVYLGNLLSAYEAIDSGVTTILDWSHGTNTHEHAMAAVEGLQASGVRAVFAYSSPAAQGGPDALPTREHLSEVQALLADDPLVDLGVATGNPENAGAAQMGRITDDIAVARELGALVTLHAGTGPPGTSAVQHLEAAGLMGDDITFIHANSFTYDDFALIASYGAHVTSSPEVEMQMGLGAAPLGVMLAAGLQPTVSVDIVAVASGELFTQLRFILQTQRMIYHQEAAAGGEQLNMLPISASDTLPYVTTRAAQSLGMSDRIGSLTPGKQADVILVDALDLNTFLCEPSAALVQAAHPGNVDTVLVGGEFVKRNKQLTGANLTPLHRDARRASQRLLA